MSECIALLHVTDRKVHMSQERHYSHKKHSPSSLPAQAIPLGHPNQEREKTSGMQILIGRVDDANVAYHKLTLSLSPPATTLVIRARNCV